MLAAHGDWYAKSLAVLKAKTPCSEADVSHGLVGPCIREILECGLGQIDSENEIKGQRPDFVCRESDGWAKVIIEVKRLNTPLATRASQSLPWNQTPVGQIERYLRGYETSRHGTWGLVTNGEDWIVLRRAGEDVERVDSARVPNLEAARRLLDPIRTSRVEVAANTSATVSGGWLARLRQSSTVSGLDLVKRLVPGGTQPIEFGSGSAMARIGSLPKPAGVLFAPEIWLASLDIDLPDGYVAPGDISENLRNIASKVHRKLGRVYGLARWTRPDGQSRCRGFFWQHGELTTTAALDPHLPGHRGSAQIRRLEQSGALPKTTPKELWGTKLRTEFYELVAKWFSRTQKRADDLRHLIRIMFVWLLQERGLIPDSALWEPSPEYGPEGLEIHHHVDWLFTMVLAIPRAERDLAEDATARQRWLAQAVPFLNGSLFTPHTPGEEPGELPNSMYQATGRLPGLFTILRRYDWTLGEQSGYERESALDPSMLGTLFERLILTVDGAHVTSSGQTQMPKGTYYTPQDLVDEMTSEAIAHWLRGKMPELPVRQIRSLAHPVPASDDWTNWTAEQRTTAGSHLRAVTVLDPSCGSGAFTVGMLLALDRARRRLEEQRAPLRDIIERQLYAIDINPLAVLITRLRLYVALVDAENPGTDSMQAAESTAQVVRPLPNLETRCVTANALCVEIGHGSGQVEIGADLWDEAVGNWQAARELWVTAHSDEEKAAVREEERKARRELKKIAAWRPKMDLAWLDVDFLASVERPATVDARLLLARPRGWDIVIGNPPYQGTNVAETTLGERLGYCTARVDLYTMFIEAALEVSDEGGCICFVVPLSVVFKSWKAFQKLRHAVEQSAPSVRIELRSYDNRPQPMFPKVDWLSTPESRQRVTVMTVSKAVRRGRGVYSAGIVRLDAGTRPEILRAEPRMVKQPRYASQWTQAPTRETAMLLERMRRDSKRTSSGGDSLPFVKGEKRRFRAGLMAGP